MTVPAMKLGEDVLSQSLTSRFGSLSNQLYSWVFREWGKITRVEPDSPRVKLGFQAVKVLSDKIIRGCHRSTA